IGLGVAIGAHFAGLFDRLPYDWLHGASYATDATTAGVAAEAPPPGSVVYPEGAPGAVPAPGLAPGTPVVLQVSYQGDDSDTDCVPRYAFFNRTDHSILFYTRSGRNGDGRAVHIDPRSSFTPTTDDDRGAYEEHSAYEGQGAYQDRGPYDRWCRGTQPGR